MIQRPDVMILLGTRPEAVKLAPIVRLLRDRGVLSYRVASTGQHRDLLSSSLLEGLELSIDDQLDVMRDRQSLEMLGSRLLDELGSLLAAVEPRCVLVQGDTSTTFVGALAAFYRGIPVGHVEAGLRSGSPDDPFPEEVHRRMVGQLARWNFAPTARAADDLLRSGVDPASITVTGNTGIDNLCWSLKSSRGVSAFVGGRPKVLATMHRRENQGEAMAGVSAALAELAADNEVVLPLHPSPSVRGQLAPGLRGSGVRTIEPLDYFDFVRSLEACDLVVTDSGGVQEEAPFLGKPVLVARTTTERPEGVAAGSAQLVGGDSRKIVVAARKVLGAAEATPRCSPYGDGHAAERICDLLEQDLFQEHNNERRGVA